MTGIAFLVTSNAQLPRVPKDSLHSLGLLAAALIVFVLALAVYKVQKEDLEVEIHNGTIYLQWNLPPKDGPLVEEGAVLVSHCSAVTAYKFDQHWWPMHCHNRSARERITCLKRILLVAKLHTGLIRSEMSLQYIPLYIVTAGEASR